MLNVWYGGPPETDILRVVDVQSGAVVTEAKVGAPQYGIDVADNGTVYRPCPPVRIAEQLSGVGKVREWS